MSSDIRLSVCFWDHPKTIKLQRHLGIEGIRSLQILWMWCRVNRPDGILTGMDKEDIEIAAKWEGEKGCFVNETLTLRWVDVNDDVYEIHDWQDHNPWSCDSEQRSDKARFSRMAFSHPEIYKDMKGRGVCAISKKDFTNITKRYNETLTNVNEILTPSPSPSPSPSQEKHIVSPESENDACPHQEIIKIYHEELPQLRKVKMWNDARRAFLRARWREDEERQNIEWWRNFFQEISKSNFLTGKAENKNGGKPFSADLEWIVRPANFVKILEGKYTNGKGQWI